MNILLWGTGKYTEKILNRGINANITGFIQTVPEQDSYKGYPVFSPGNLPDDYDLILVSNKYSDEIFEVSKINKIDIRKMIFLFKGVETKFVYFEGLEDVLGEETYTEYLIQYGTLKKSFVDKDAQLYEKLNKRLTFRIEEQYLWPIINDKYVEAGVMTNYFHQDLWAAKIIIQKGIKQHFDIGSRIDGFITHLLAAGIKVNLVDIRPFPYEVENLTTIIDDATELNHLEDNSVESLSALCSLEHLGLGRYGDPVDPEACFKCFSNIPQKIKQGGDLYISVPVGKERVCFNAHRVFFAQTIIDEFAGMELKEFACVANGSIEYDVEIHKYDDSDEDGDYRYGLFHFVKL